MIFVIHVLNKRGAFLIGVRQARDLRMVLCEVAQEATEMLGAMGEELVAATTYEMGELGNWQTAVASVVELLVPELPDELFFAERVTDARHIWYQEKRYG